jgi:hypothetical protein
VQPTVSIPGQPAGTRRSDAADRSTDVHPVAAPAAPKLVSRRRRNVTIVSLVCVVVVAAAVFGAARLVDRPTADEPRDVPVASTPGASLVTKEMVDGILLRADELNPIVGSTGLVLIRGQLGMSDESSSVDNLDCLGVKYTAQKRVHSGSGWTAVRDQVAQEPGGSSAHWVGQTAVLYETPERARAFFDGSRSQWKRCAGQPISDGGSVWQIEDVSEQRSNLITQRMTENDANGWACQHALAVMSNLTVEGVVCGFSVKDEAVTIADRMIANASRT